MIDLEQLEYEMGQKIRFAYPIQEPDQSFVDRLHSELEQKISVSGKSIQGQKYSSRNSHWIGRTKLLFSPIAWVAIAIILILSMIWGIKTLIPGVIPGSKHESSPTPFVTQTSLPTEIPPLSIGNAIIYTVAAGDTLSTIESKTKVSVDSLINLNAFVLQANELSPGLQLITGFEGQVPVFYTVQPGDTILGISEMAGISVEDFVSLNRIENYSQGTQTHPVDPQYTLTPGMQVIIGLENANHSKNQGANGDQLILSEVQ
jgi:LysM repeat protein